MTNIVGRLDPFSEIARLASVGGADWWRNLQPRQLSSASSAEQRMRVDVSETERDYVIAAEIPGARREDIWVEVDRRRVSIWVALKRDKETEQGSMLHSERFYGELRRTFGLVQEIDEGKVVAKYVDGVLQLVLPKRTSRPATTIAIN